MRKPTRRQLWMIVGALLLVLLIATQLRESPMPVETGLVTRGPMRVTIDEEGRARVRDRYVVSAPVSGRLDRILLRAGDQVERGMVVARLLPAALEPRLRAEAQAGLIGAQSTLREAEAALPAARSAAEQTDRDARRAATLLAAGAVSERELEDARLRQAEANRALAAATERVAQAQAGVQRAHAAATEPGGGGAVTINAPVSGRVLRLLEQDQRVLLAGTPILEIGDPRNLEIVVDLRSEDAVRVLPGAMMLLDEWGGTESMTARVQTVEPHAFTQVSALGVEEQRVNVIGSFGTTPTQLGDGYRVGVRIVVWESADALRVPTGALFRDAGGWSVFVVESGRAHRRQVQVGQQSAEYSEVIAGLAERDTVVMHPSDRVSDGRAVAQ